MHKLMLGIILVSGLGIGAYLVFRTTDAVNVDVDTVPPQSELRMEDVPKPPLVASDWQAPTLMADTYQSAFGELPVSLKGTQIPFDLKVNVQNHLIVNLGLREVFDYFFTTVGEEDVSVVIQRVEELLTKHLPAPASGQARDIYQQYIALKKGEMALSRQLITDPQKRMTMLKEVRQGALTSDVYEAFYGMEDQRAEYSLRRHEVLSDQSLSEQQKMAALNELDQQVPEHMRSAKEEKHATQGSQDLLQEIQKSRMNNVREDTILQGLNAGGSQ